MMHEWHGKYVWCYTSTEVYGYRRLGLLGYIHVTRRTCLYIIECRLVQWDLFYSRGPKLLCAIYVLIPAIFIHICTFYLVLRWWFLVSQSSKSTWLSEWKLLYGVYLFFVCTKALTLQIRNGDY